jgi:hypothetical protein
MHEENAYVCVAGDSEFGGLDEEGTVHFFVAAGFVHEKFTKVVVVGFCEGMHVKEGAGEI